MDIKNILKYMPHRYPFVLIDKVVDFKANDFLVAIKNVTMNEPCFQGHFPENPVMPGVLIIESMAQASALLGYKSLEANNETISDDKIFYFAGMDKVRFKKVVVPGDQLIVKVKQLSYKMGICKTYGEVYVNDELVCSADLIAAYKGIDK